MLTTYQQVLFNLLEPVGFIWGVLVLLALWALIKRRLRLAIAPAAIALLMFLLGSTGFPDWLLGSLERQCPAVAPADAPPADAVVMLGGGLEPSRREAFGLGLNADGDRLVMALELMRHGKGKVLVLGGGQTPLPNGQILVEADLLQRWLAEWKLPSAPIISLGGCDNTHEEAVKVARLCRERHWQKVLLVTSAYHLPRALATFQTEGVPVTGIPCDYKTSISRAAPPSYILVPRYHGMVQASIYVREQLAGLVYRWRDWIKIPPNNPA